MRRVGRSRIEPFGPQALPDPKLACGRECRGLGRFASVDVHRTNAVPALGCASVQGDPRKAMEIWARRRHRIICTWATAGCGRPCAAESSERSPFEPFSGRAFPIRSPVPWTPILSQLFCRLRAGHGADDGRMEGADWRPRRDRGLTDGAHREAAHAVHARRRLHSFSFPLGGLVNESPVVR